MEKPVFLAKIKERYCLNPGSEKQTYHLVIDLQDSNIEYAVGDCLGIYPENPPEMVSQLIQTLQLPRHAIIQDRQGRPFPLDEFLTRHANLARFPTTTADGAEACKKIPPLLPRFYSIASSQTVVGQEAHLTIALLDGVCSDYLCCRAPLNQPVIPIFLHPSRNFSLPPESSDKPVIMIGPGTGVAPFRGFIQERVSRQFSAKNWLFFGHRTRQHDFYYENDWDHFIKQGKLQLDCAFSRDQPDKVYIQHRLHEKSSLIWEWIREGAYLYVCGDASQMAKDVDKALHTIVEKEGHLSPSEAKAFIKQLKTENRYQRDVY